MISHQDERQAKVVASQCLSRNIKEKLYSGNKRLVINQRIDRWHCKELIEQGMDTFNITQKVNMLILWK